MTRISRRSVLAAVGVSLTTAGCVTELEGAPTTTKDWIEQASEEPDPDLSIYLNNESEKPRTIRVRVVREDTGEAVFEKTRKVSAGTQLFAYNLKQAEPEGVETFRICGKLVGRSEPTVTTANEESDARNCATVETNECYGDTYVTVQKDGSIRVIYAIC